MSTLPAVRRAFGVVLGDANRPDDVAGVGCFVLPDGHFLTCHHVIYGLSDIFVRVDGDPTPRHASYVAERSDPGGDIVVLRVDGGAPGCAQVAKSQVPASVHGIGYRPSAAGSEQEHTFTGALNPGEVMTLLPSAASLARLQAADPGRAWNVPLTYRRGPVLNFNGGVEFEPGISGGPVYNPALRKVTGLFRAVEDKALSYVLPMERVFKCWPELEVANAQAVADDQFDTLAKQFGLRDVVLEGKLPIPPMSDLYFKDFLRKQRLFGPQQVFSGRGSELRRLDAFAQGADGGYMFVTGESGVGKTALLGHWVQVLAARGKKRAIHFITTKVNADEDFFLAKLSKELLAFHDLGSDKDVPTSLEDLRVVYPELLQLRALDARLLIVVIDAIDEGARRWRPEPPWSALFPVDLSPNIRVVFSAQEQPDRNWLELLELPLPPERIMRLGPFQEPDTREVLRRSTLTGLPSPAFELALSVMQRVSSGDPLYLRDLVAAVEHADGNLAAIENYPPDISRRLAQWWDQGRAREPEGAFDELIGTLATAPRPLSLDDLAAIGDEDPKSRLRRSNLNSALEIAGEFVDAEKTGYALQHERVREFVTARLAEQMPTFQARLFPFLRRDEARRARQYEESLIRATGEGARTLDFDWVDASKSNVDAEPYLRERGIEIADKSPDTRVDIVDMRNYYGGNAVVALTPYNMLTQNATSGDQRPVSFTLRFKAPLQRLSLTRPYLFAATPSGVTHPAWSAHALDAAGRALGSTGERIWGWAQRGYKYDRILPQVFTLEGPGIVALRVDSDNEHFAGCLGVLIDDLTLVPTP